MEDKNGVDDSHSILCVKGIHLPVKVTDWVFKETSNVFICSPALSIVSWFLGALDKLSEVTISLLS